MGFEPTPLRTAALTQRLRPLDHLAIRLREIIIVSVFLKWSGKLVEFAASYDLVLNSLYLCPSTYTDNKENLKLPLHYKHSIQLFVHD